MTKSVLEQELMRGVVSLRSGLVTHDRGVVFGLLLTLVPVFPVPVLGVLLALFHLRMYRAGKLGDYDYLMVRRSLLIGIVTSTLSLLLIWYVAGLAREVDWATVLTYLPQRMAEFLRSLLGTSGTKPGVTTV